MTQKSITSEIPFESLANAIFSLSIEDKRKLHRLLEDEIADAEEDLLEEAPSIQAEIEAARKAYQTGDYLTLEEYIAQRSSQESSKAC